MAGDHQEGVFREDVPQPVRNVIVPGEIQYPPHIDAANYNNNAAHYHPSMPPVSDSHQYDIGFPF